MTVRYSVRAVDPEEHRARFTLDLEGVAPTVDLVLPSWVPGSYHIVNYVRGFRDMRARDPATNRPLNVERVDKARWRVHTDGAPAVHIEYSVYGHDLVTEAFDFTSEHLFLNAALCLPYVEGRTSEPAEVTLHLPPSWKSVSELEEVTGHPPTYRARNYDELVDSPIDAGHPTVLTIRPLGIPHRIVLCGQGGNYETHRLEEDLGKLVTATVQMLGDSPLAGYTFFLHLTDVPDGGLEHATSHSAVVRRLAFQPGEMYRRFLGLESHEYFHLYNVKRVRPKAIVPFDYTREMYTRLLWWMEGTTDYFSDLVLRRAGLLTVPQFLDRMAEEVKEFEATPGRRRQSLEESSFLSWVDYYQPYEETPNQSISYYLKGALVSMALDLEVRHRTETAKSLETAMRYLWQNFGKLDQGVGEEELQPAIEAATGLDLGPFFDRFVRGTEELDLDGFAQYAGLHVGAKPRDPDDPSDEPGYLGIRCEDAGGLARVRVVLADTPGRRAGISPGDELVALNGSKVTYSGLDKMMQATPPGTAIDLTLFRRGFLRTVSLTTGKPPAEKYRFTPVDAPDELAKKVYASWLGAPWEPAKKGPG